MCVLTEARFSDFDEFRIKQHFCDDLYLISVQVKYTGISLRGKIIADECFKTKREEPVYLSKGWGAWE